MFHHNVVGIDISKAHLDAHRLPSGETRQFSNDPPGLRKLRRWLRAAAPVELVVYEPTGHWHRALEETLLADGLAAAPVNPLQARRFAQALGQRAKTDRVDARMLAGMGVAHGAQLHGATASTSEQRELRDLQVQRVALVAERTAVLQRRKRPQPALVRRQLRGHQRLLERQLAALDAATWSLIRDHAGLARKAQILRSIPSVGPGHGRDAARIPAGIGPDQREGCGQSDRFGPLCPGVGNLERPEAASRAAAPGCARACTWRPFAPCATTPNSSNCTSG